MKAKLLWEELKRQRQSLGADFDALDVYVEIVDQGSYDRERAADEQGGDITLTDTVISEGWVFSVVHMMAAPPSADTFLLIRAVELQNEEPDEQITPS